MRLPLRIAALAASCLVIATPAMAQRGPNSGGYSQPAPEDARFAAAQQRFANEFAIYQAEYDRFQAARAARLDRGGDRRGYNDDRRGYDDDRDEGSYDPARDYRDGPRYRERTLASDERVYRGRDGRYYCKRNDGTTGLIVGALAGGALGNAIDGGHSRTAGTLIGAIAGAVAGQAIDRDSSREIRCR